MKTLKILFGFFWTFLSIPTLSAQDFLVTNVHIVTMDGEELLENHALFVKDGKIDRIIPLTPQTPRMSHENLIDGQGAYIFPGLA